MRVLSVLVPILLLAACGGGSSSGGSSSTPPATTPPVAAPAVPVSYFFPADNGVNGKQLWKTDSTEAGTSMVKVINSSGNADIEIIGPLGDKTVFTANDGVHGKELWITDGTEAGTVLVKDINTSTSNSGSADVSSPVVMGGNLYFTAWDDVNGAELWKSDGTNAGTVLVRDIRPGTNGSNVAQIVVLGSAIYFKARAGTGPYELWKSDGTEAGTEVVSTGGLNPSNIRALNGAIYFSGYTIAAGYELWKSDGTTQGTLEVADIFPGTTSSYPRDIVAMGGDIYFAATGSTAEGEELWRSDGSSTGTTSIVKNINPSTGSANHSKANIKFLSAVGGKLYFTAKDMSGGKAQQWVSDGTLGGTIMLHAAVAVPGSSNTPSVYYMMAAESQVYFLGADAINGQELWKTDGTIAGTVIVKDAVPGVGGADFYSLGDYYHYSGDSAPVVETLSGSALLVGYSSEHGQELWKTDGTAAGTVLVKDINPGALDGF